MGLRGHSGNTAQRSGWMMRDSQRAWGRGGASVPPILSMGWRFKLHFLSTSVFFPASLTVHCKSLKHHWDRLSVHPAGLKMCVFVCLFFLNPPKVLSSLKDAPGPEGRVAAGTLKLYHSQLLEIWVTTTCYSLTRETESDSAAR